MKKLERNKSIMTTIDNMKLSKFGKFMDRQVSEVATDTEIL